MLLRNRALQSLETASFKIFIDETKPDIVGSVMHPVSSLNVPFVGTIRLVGILDSIMNQYGTPNETHPPRYKKRFASKNFGKGLLDMTENITTVNKDNEKVVFVLKVLYRQNATWQGILTTEKGDSFYYRSVLELIKIIDGCLEGRDMTSHSVDPSKII